MDQVQAALTPIGQPSADDLKAINRMALEPLEKEQVFVYQSEVSNTIRDSYHTVMDDKTTLRNYVENFKDGLSLLANHKTDRLGMGRTFAGWLEQRGSQSDPKDPPRTAAISKTYIPLGIRLDNGQTTDDIIRGIKTGIYKDESIHFANARYICSECSEDMLRSQSCNHLPGLEYGRGEGAHLAYARIEGASAVEKSLVFEGSTPRAMTEKAQRMVEAGQLTSKQVRQFEESAGVRMQGKFPTAREVCPMCGMVLDNRKDPKDPCPQCGYKLEPDQSKNPSDPASMKDGSSKNPTGVGIGNDATTPIGGVSTYSVKEGDHRILDEGHDLVLMALAIGSVRDAWTGSYKNDLPDSAFAYIEPGGKKDAGGKTVPRSLRHYPHHGAGGGVDEAHVRLALQMTGSPHWPNAQGHINSHASALGIKTGSDSKSAEGGSMDPKVFSSLIGSLADVAEEVRAAIVDPLFEKAGDACNRAFVEAVATDFVASAERAGKVISADTASKIQGTLDELAKGADSTANAQKALKMLVSLGLADADTTTSDAGQNKPKSSDAPTGASGAKIGVKEKPLGAAGAGGDKDGGAPAKGNVGRAASGGGGGSATVGATGDAGMTVPGDHKKKLMQVQALLVSLLSDYKDQSADNAQGQDGSTGDGGSSTAKGGGAAQGQGGQVQGRSEIDRLLEQSPDIRTSEFSDLRAVLVSAREGKRFREHLVDELHTWGVRARGADYNKGLHERMERGLAIGDIQALVTQFESEARGRFTNAVPGDIPDWARDGLSLAASIGRQTMPSDPYRPPEGAAAIGNGNVAEIDLSSVEMFKARPGVRPV